MKKSCVLGLMFLASVCLVAVNSDPVLMKIHDIDVTRSEFEYAFNKNNSTLSNESKTVQEYLPIYIDFKLKVAEALALRLDTLESFRKEFKADRERQAEDYLIDKQYIENEARKLYINDSMTVGRDGFLKVSHIMFPMRQNISSDEQKQLKAKVDTAYQMIINGMDYVAVAKYYMNDEPDTFEILRGQAYKEFENAAYSLSDGGVSGPVMSPAGYHIIKRFSHRPFGSYKEYRNNILSILEKRNIKRVARYRLGYALAKQMAPGTTPEQALAHEDSLLETKYPEFGNLMREYRDGLLFFEVSNREVWKKAATDEEGLARYFKKNKKKYRFDKPHFRGAVIYAHTDEDLHKAQSLLKGVGQDRYREIIEDNFMKDSVSTVKLEVGVFPIGDNAWVDKCVFGQGNGGRLKYGSKVVGTVGKILEKKPETYNDVRGLVINDYQQYLEKKWLEKLHAKYKVEVYQDILKTVNNH